MRYKLKYIERTEDHFSGKKKPWQGRLSNQLWVDILWLIVAIAGITLYILKSEWIVFYILYLSVSLWGLAEIKKGNYYKLGYDDSAEDQQGKNILDNANTATSKRVTLDLDDRVYRKIEEIKEELSIRSRGTVINQILLEILLADEDDSRAEY